MFQKSRQLLIMFLFMTANILSGAEVTDVADAFDYKNPYDINISLSYNNSHHFSNLKREYNSAPSLVENDGSIYYTTESRRVETLEYTGNLHSEFYSEILLNLEIGLYKDLSFTIDLPFIINNLYSLTSKNQSDDKSLIMSELFVNDTAPKYNHRGVGDLGTGLRYNPFNQERGVDAYTFLLAFKIFFPVASVQSPAKMNKPSQEYGSVTSGTNGSPGSGMFTFELQTAVSKKYDVVEPYGMFTTRFPLPSSKAVADDPPFTYIINSGLEFYVWKNNVKEQSINIITDFELLYNTKGQRYNSITDARWVYTDSNPPDGYNASNMEDAMIPMEDPFIQSKFTIKTRFAVAKYVNFGTHFGFGYRQKHYLTSAVPGKDGYIAGLDDEKFSTEDGRGRDGGRIIDELHLIIDWGLNLKVLF